MRRGEWYVTAVDVGDRYYQLSLLGREAFLSASAQGALVFVERPRRVARGTAGDPSASSGAIPDLAPALPVVLVLPPRRRKGETAARKGVRGLGVYVGVGARAWGVSFLILLLGGFRRGPV